MSVRQFRFDVETVPAWFFILTFNSFCIKNNYYTVRFLYCDYMFWFSKPFVAPSKRSRSLTRVWHGGIAGRSISRAVQQREIVGAFTRKRYTTAKYNIVLCYYRVFWAHVAYLSRARFRVVLVEKQYNRATHARAPVGRSSKWGGSLAIKTDDNRRRRRHRRWIFFWVVRVSFARIVRWPAPPVVVWPRRGSIRHVIVEEHAGSVVKPATRLCTGCLRKTWRDILTSVFVR